MIAIVFPVPTEHSTAGIFPSTALAVSRDVKSVYPETQWIQRGDEENRHSDSTLSHTERVDPYSELQQLDFAETTHLSGSSRKSFGRYIPIPRRACSVGSLAVWDSVN